MRDMRLKNKIIVGIVIILLLSTVPEISLFIGLRNVAADLDMLYDDAWIASQNACRIREGIVSSYGIIGKSLLRRNKYISDMNMEDLLSEDRAMRDCAYMLQGLDMDYGTKEAADLSSALDDWRQVRNDMAALLFEEDYEGAADIYSGELDRLTSNASKAAEGLDDAAKMAAGSYVSAASERKRMAMTVALFLIAVKIGVAAFILFRLVRAVMRPLKNIRAAVDLVSRGTDVMEHIRHDTRDEYAAVADICKYLAEQAKSAGQRMRSLEEKFKKTISDTNDLVWEWDLTSDRIRVIAPEVWQRMYGKDFKGENDSLSFMNLIAVGDNSGELLQRIRELEKGNQDSLRLEFRHNAGVEEKRACLRCVPVRGEGGDVECIMGFIIDVA